MEKVGWNLTSTLIEKLICRCTLIAFDYSEKKPKAFGSLLFIKGYRAYYLVTAAHVLETWTNMCGIQLENKYLKIPRSNIITSISTNESDDLIDLAIIKISENKAAKLEEKYTPLLLKLINVSRREYCEDAHFTLFGYPSTNKFIDINIMTGSCSVEPLIYHVNLMPWRLSFDELGYNINNHIILNNDTYVINRSGDSNVPNVKSLEGISGSGVWLFRLILRGDYEYIECSLAGIINFNRKAIDFNCIIATRIEYVTEVLRRKFGEPIEPSDILGNKVIEELFTELN